MAGRRKPGIIQMRIGFFLEARGSLEIYSGGALAKKITIAVQTAAARINVTSGLHANRPSPPSTSASSTRLREMFVNGSGEVLAASRVPAFAAWEENAIPPASSAAATSKAGWASPMAATASAAAPMGRMIV